MKFKFYNFTLDTKKQTVFHHSSEIDITKINYQVLLFFIQHQSEVVTKDQIIDAVWQGKMVTDNSIDQSISKIRKSLGQYDNRVIIKTVYGKGLEFTPSVTCIDDEDNTAQSKPINKQNSWLKMAFLMGLIIIVWQTMPLLLNQPRAGINQTPVMWLSDENNNDWLNQSSHHLLNQVFATSGTNYQLDTQDKPKQLSNQQYINNYWRINPDLEVIKTSLEQQDDEYKLTLTVTSQSGEVNDTFEGKNLLKLMTDANQWLLVNSSLSDQNTLNQTLLPKNAHVLELHLRSLHAFSQGELDQALNYAQLAIDQEPGFYFARLQLAQIQYAQGNNEQSIATLDSLTTTAIYPQLEIAIQTLRGDILDTTGDYQQAIDIYQQLIQSHPEATDTKLLPVKFNMSFPLAALHRYDEALTVLNEVITALSDQFDMDLLADAYHKKGSILLQIGKTKTAKEAANLAYQHFNDLSDFMGTAKVTILLARIANHESDYQQAADYLKQSIGIYRHAEYPLGVGATLNELIYTQMVNGQFSQAWTHMLEMRQIALDIDYFAMLMAAKQFEIEIARAREQWIQAETGLADYLRLATENNFTRGLVKHQLFELDLALDQQQTERAQNVIHNVQKHIDSSGEARLQPRLNTQQARIYFLNNKPEQAVELLNKTKAMALLTDDMESIHEINNELLEFHIDNQDFKTAMGIINAIGQSESQPLAYPYTLLKSKVYLGLGETQLAIKWAVQCKSQANEFWRPADELYLISLLKT